MNKFFILISFKKHLQLFLIISFTFYFSVSQAQTPQFDWVGIGQTSFRSITNDVEIDQQGNIFYAGSFWGFTDFDPGPGQAIVSTQFNGLAGAFVVKLDSNKNFLWVKTFVNSDFNGHIKMKLDNQGNILLIGNPFNHIMDYDPDTTATENRTYLSYILKLDNDGNFVWVKGIENQTLAQSIFTDVELDTWGNIHIAGAFKGIIDINFDQAVNGMSAANWESYILKVNPNGDFLWVKDVGPYMYFGPPTDIAVDYAGNIYRTAQFDGSIDVDPDSTFYLLNGAGSYLLKLDSAGHFMWAKQYTNIAPTEITTSSNGAIYFTGSFTDTANFNPNATAYNLTSIGNSDIFISKLTENGNLTWVKSFGGTLNDKGANLTLDPSENIYLTGYFEGTANFSTDTNLLTYQSNGSTDLFISKLDSSGNMLFTKVIGGVATENVSDIKYSNDDIYIGGAYTELIDFDFGPGIQSEHSYASTYIGELFVLKLKQAVSVFSSADTITICMGDTIMLNSGYPIGNSWNTGDTTQFIHVATSGIYSVSVNNGAFISDTIVVNVILPNSGTISISASDTLVCMGSQVQLLANTTSAIQPGSFSWSVNGAITTTLDSNFVANIGNSSTINCYITNTNLCSNLLNLYSNTIAVNTYPATPITFNAPQSNTWMCTNDPAFILTGGAPIGGIYSGSGVSDSTFTPSPFLPTLNEIYYTYQDSNSCFSQAVDTFYVDVCTAQANKNMFDLISSFPNPVKDIISLVFPSNLKYEMCNLKIIDVVGKTVHVVIYLLLLFLL